MGNSRLAQKIETLPEAQRLAVENLVDVLAAETLHGDRNRLNQVIAAARGSWPRKMTTKDIDAEVRAMRAEWNKSAKEAK